MSFDKYFTLNYKSYFKIIIKNLLSTVFYLFEKNKIKATLMIKIKTFRPVAKVEERFRR